MNYIPEYKTFRAFKNKFFSRSKYYLLFIMISPLFILGQKKSMQRRTLKVQKSSATNFSDVIKEMFESDIISK